jgi:hypothetical protein
MENLHIHGGVVSPPLASDAMPIIDAILSDQVDASLLRLARENEGE